MNSPARRSGRTSPRDEFPARDDAISPIRSVDRALRLLTVLAEYDLAGERLGVIAERLGEDKASVHRSLDALQHRFFAQQIPETGNYALGPAALGLADSFLQRDGLRPLVHAALLELCERTDETANTAVPEGRFVRFVDKVDPDRNLRMGSYVGARYPMWSTALGRAMLSVSCVTPQQLDAFLGQSSADVWPHVQAAIDRGYAVENEDNEINVTCVGVPILFGSRAVMAVSISGPTQRMVGRIDEFGRLLHAVVGPQLPPRFRLPDLSA